MSVDLSKLSHILLFVVVMPAVSLLVAGLAATAWPNPPFWVETLSPLAAFGLLYYGFDRYAWAWPVWRWLGIVRAPDLRGRWMGEQVSVGEDGEKLVSSRVVLEVEQTFSTVRAVNYYRHWAKARCISTFLDIDGGLLLVMIFEANPRPDKKRTRSSNRGVAQLEYIPTSGMLCGSYFNSQKRQGYLEFRRTGRTLLNTFAVDLDKKAQA